MRATDFAEALADYLKKHLEPVYPVSVNDIYTYVSLCYPEDGFIFCTYTMFLFDDREICLGSTLTGMLASIPVGDPDALDLLISLMIHSNPVRITRPGSDPAPTATSASSP